MSAVLKLGYWNIRGLAQPIRCLLEFTGAQWEDVLYCQADGNAPIPYDKSCWFGVKDSIGLDFPNLPYAIDGNVKLSQSKAIMRHVVRKRPDMSYLFGRTSEDMDQVDQLLDEYSDIGGRLTGIQYSRGIDTAFIEGDLKHNLQLISKYLGVKTWFLGEYITLADFVMYEYVCRAKDYTEQAGFADYFTANGISNLLTHHEGFERLPMIANYLKSDRFAAISGYNNQHAKWR